MSYRVLALKWRPQTFDEVAGQDAIAQTLKNAIRMGRTAHAYLFTGPRGVGKTSTARILAKALNCVKGPTPDPDNECDACREITGGRSLDVLEIDGASNRGIDDIRELRESVRYAPASGRTKVYIIDEVHMLTTDAFNALLKTLEEPPSHVVFVLATTEPLKVPATIVSRCQRYDFSRLRLRDTVERLRSICEAEGIEIAEDALALVGRRAEGSMRDALTLLDQVVASGRSPLDAAAVGAALGIAGRELYFALSDAMISQDPRAALGVLATAYGEGQNLQEVAEEWVHHLRNLLVLAVDEKLAEIVDATDSERARYREQVARVRPADLIRQLHLAIDTSTRMRRSGFPRVLLEVAIAESCLMPRSADLAAWIRELPGVPAAAAPHGAPASSAGPSPTSASTHPSTPAPAPGSPPVLPARSAQGGGPPPRSTPTAHDGGGRAASIAAVAAEPAPLLEEVSTDPTWTAFVQKLRQKRPALAASLSAVELLGEDGGYLRIRLPADRARFATTTLESTENRPIILEAIRETFGRPIGLRVENGGSSEAAAATAAPVPAAAPAIQARSNLSDIQRIAEQMDGEILGPS
jgi:DNA polymerase-3 subunit gamma/tau